MLISELFLKHIVNVLWLWGGASPARGENWAVRISKVDLAGQIFAERLEKVCRYFVSEVKCLNFLRGKVEEGLASMSQIFLLKILVLRYLAQAQGDVCKLCNLFSKTLSFEPSIFTVFYFVFARLAHSRGILLFEKSTFTIR